MANASSIPYQLRPNKSVDRELFVLLLSRTIGLLHTDQYQYIGLGGPFLEDFRLIHSRIGIKRMTCIDVDENTVERQIFNRPFPGVQCICDRIESFISNNEFVDPIVVWFDYTDPGDIVSQIDSFVGFTANLPLGSILRITLNANPESLGKYDPSQETIDLLKWRVQSFCKLFGNNVPQSIKEDDVKRKQYGKLILKTLKISMERRILEMKDRYPFWVLAVNYADGQPMVTATLIIVPKEDTEIKALMQDWDYYSTPDHPLYIDIPTLSSKERIALETSEDISSALPHDLPKGALSLSPLEMFQKFYRVYPNFAKIDE